MLLAMTGYQMLLLVVAAIFITFALVSALVIPRSKPGFPGKGLGVFLAICVLMFAAQLTAVLVLAEIGEADQPAKEETTSAQPTEPVTTTESTATESTGTTATESTETGTTESTGTETGTTTESTPGQPAGDPVAGKEVFLTVAEPSCGGCHTLADAGTDGSVGPNLDDLKPSYDAVVKQVTAGGGVMPSFKDSLTEQQIQDVAAYVSSVAGT